MTTGLCHRMPMQWVEERVHRLRNLLRRYGRSRDDADDLIQEAFLRLHLYCQDKEVHKQDAFLSRTVMNLSVDLHRKEHRDLYTKEPLENLVLVDLKPTPDEDLAAARRRQKELRGAKAPEGITR